MNELAQEYFPRSTKRSAVTQLHRWVVLCVPLQRKLEELSFHKGQKVLTPLQHEAMVAFLGGTRRVTDLRTLAK